MTTRRDGTTIYYRLRSQKMVQAVDLLREFMAEILTEQAKLAQAVPSA